MIRACGERAKKYVLCGWRVRAWRRAGTRAHVRGESLMLGYEDMVGKKVV